MSCSQTRSLLTLAAVFFFPLMAGAQATQPVMPTTKPITTAKPARVAAVKPAPAPAVAASGPARDARGRFIAKGATSAAGNHAMCKDGTSWSGAQRSGACARHGGVKAWN